MTQQTALVSGGAGFIGSHLADSLLVKGYRVIVVDNLLTGKKENLKLAEKNSDFRFIQEDITKEPLAFDHIDFMYHLASPASVPDYQKYPFETAHVNSQGTQIMLELAKKHSAKFLFTSTSEIYGDPEVHPQKETYWGNVNPHGVRACYDESKRFGEMMTMLYVRSHDIDARIARIFNTYGDRMRPDDGRVISNFINQAIDNKPITVYGNGTQTRSFCFVSDLVEGLVRLMEQDNTKGEVVNLGNPDEYSVLDLAKKIKLATSSSSEIVFKDLPKDDPRMRRPDITKAQEVLSWTPQTTLEVGLQKTIDHYRSLQ